MQQRNDNPYAVSLVHKNNPDSFKTTYGNSYNFKMPTLEVSPAYEPLREPPAPGRWYPYDLSPYPSARDNSPIRNRRPYQPMSYYEEAEFARQQKERDFRSRFEDATLRRDEYSHPPPAPMHQYDQEEAEFERHHHQHRGQHHEKMREARADYLRRQYDDLVVEGQSTDPRDLKNVFCNKCFKSDACLNKLGCSHQYCDDCMALMPGSDGPFRDSIRWHYCCEACNKWTPESKLVRTDPRGRRMDHRPSSR